MPGGSPSNRQEGFPGDLPVPLLAAGADSVGGVS